MPRMPGMELGPAPPDAPRALPRHFAFRLKWSQNIGVIIGLGMLLICGVMFAAMLKAHTWLAVAPALFSLLGLLAFVSGRRDAANTLRAFRHGMAAEGRIASVAQDTTQSVNGRHPWRMVYHFTAGDQPREGVITSFDSTLASRRSGQPLWVLYMPDDPDQSTPYPPLTR